MARQQRDDAQSTALSTEVQPPRLPYPVEAAKQFKVSAGQWKALTDAVFPSAKTVDGVILALSYCHARNLDVFKRVVHVVPMWNSKLRREVETVWPGIGELRTTAHRTGKMAGNDDCVFGPTIKRPFEATREYETGSGNERRKVVDRESCPEMEFPEWAQITVYRMVEGVRCAFIGPKVRFTETFSGIKGVRVPNARWQLAPFQMLEKCAEAAALRRAFPEELGDVASAEEMEGKDVAGDVIDGEYTVVDGAKDEARPTRSNQEDPPREEEKRQDPPKPKYTAQIDRELANIRKKISETGRWEPLTGAREAELQRLSGWPKEARLELRHAFNDRIKALGGDPADKHDTRGESADEMAERARDITNFMASYGDELAQRVGSMPDLNSFNSANKALIAAMPEVERLEYERLFAIASAVAKDGGDSDDFFKRIDESAGEAAAGDEGEGERPEEEQ